MLKGDTEEMRFPTARHRNVLEECLATYRADAEILAALLSGSLARGAARSDSDIDLLLVVSHEPSVTAQQVDHGPIVVDQIARTEEGWRKQFSPSRVGDESWGYAFLDGVAIYDPHGIGADLVVAAAEAHATYRTPNHIWTHFRTFWSHLQPKMDAVLRRDDAIEIGWAAAVMTSPLTDTLWAVNHRPLPSRDLGCFQRHLDDLTIPPDAPALVREMLQSSPRDALTGQLRLLELVLPHLRESDADQLD